TLVEYASWTCPACLDFHARIMPSVKTDYVDAGKVKLVFREFPTAPANIAVAGFAVARCTDDAQYYDVLDELFMRQDAILTLARQGGPVVEALKQIGANHGIEGDETFQACLDDQANRDAIRASIAAARGQGVDATPTFFLNGEKMDDNARISPVTFTAALDEALGEPASE
ncbi:MAG: thioredoxin domain-containing protein, partial [Pseudomonadota bacterium]